MKPKILLKSDKYRAIKQDYSNVIKVERRAVDALEEVSWQPVDELRSAGEGTTPLTRALYNLLLEGTSP
jgi:hypothetical protein